jgi:hypothetical protein
MFAGKIGVQLAFIAVSIIFGIEGTHEDFKESCSVHVV